MAPFKGDLYKFGDTEDEIEKLQTDDLYAHKYILKNLGEEVELMTVNLENNNYLTAAVADEEIILPIKEKRLYKQTTRKCELRSPYPLSADPVASTSKEGFRKELTSRDDAEDFADDDPASWSSSATKLLISCRLGLEDLLHRKCELRSPYPLSADPVASTSKEGFRKELTSRDDAEDFADDDPASWSSSATKLLISCRLGLEDRFCSGGVTAKKTLWGKISRAMADNGYTTTREKCENKFKSLLVTYKRNVKKKEQTGEGKITWPFFVEMDEFYGKRASVNTPKERLLASSSSSSENVGTETQKRKNRVPKTTPIFDPRADEEREQRDVENAFLEERINLLKERNMLLERKVRADEEKNGLLKELINLMKDKQ